jgi:nucleotide-binding universal stress UspA family protein
MSTPHRILLATDGSEQSALAARIAADLARAWHAELHIVEAWSAMLPYAAYGGLGTAPVLSGDTIDQLEAASVETMAAAREIARGRGCTAVIEHRIDSPQAVDAILDVARAVDAELIVAGRRGLGAMGRLFLGSVSEGLVHRSTRPMLLVHGDASCWPPRTVVAAVDGSGESARAAELGAAVAAAAGAVVELVHAVPRDADLLDGLSEPDYDGAVAEVTEQYTREAQALAEQSGAPVHPRVDLAAAVPAIMSAAGDCPSPTLVAMGTHGRGAAYRLVLGSVSTTVLHDERTTSVLIVPPPTRGTPHLVVVESPTGATAPTAR